MMITSKNKIAADKLEKNVAEFIIHIYQMEDLCRVYNFNLDEIETFVIHHFPLDEAEKVEIKEWFAWLIAEMKSQGTQERGHITQVQTYLDELVDLKFRLLSEDHDFKERYQAAKPYIREIIEESDHSISSDIQACINGVYGLLLARMNGRTIPEELEVSLNTFGDVLSCLSFKYKEEKDLRPN